MHFTSINGSQILEEGQRVEFDVVEGAKGTQALAVDLVA